MVFIPLYLMFFFSFLRLENIVPHSSASFDISRHLTREDLKFSDSFAIIIVKFAKTIQFRDRIAHISIPALPGSMLCPVTALENMLAYVTLITK